MNYSAIKMGNSFVQI